MSASTNLQHSLSDLVLDNQRFTSRDEIKPWLQDFLLNKKGIHIVIARSDSNKIIFKCKSGKNRDDMNQKMIKSRRQTSCPFKVRANYSIRNKVWTLVVINDTHDHDIDGFGLVQQGKFTDLFPHRKNDDAELLQGANDTTSTLTPTSSKNNATADVFGSFIPSSEIVSPSLQHNVGLGHTMDEVKGGISPKTANNENDITRIYHGHNNRKRQSPGTNNAMKKSKNDRSASHEQEPSSAKSSKEIVDDLREHVNLLISNNIFNNGSFIDSEKSVMLKSFISTFINDYRNIITSVVNQQKTVLNSWLSTPNSNQSNMHASANANLIPLSPLLNDTDADYSGGAPNNNNHHHQSMDTLAHLPNMNLGSSLITSIAASNSNNIASQNSASNNFMIPSQAQLLQIQNQNQQLPSFNTIQNQLPLSPNSLANNSTASLFVNNLNTNTSSASNSNSMIPPRSNSNANATLNPSHLLKSSNSKNLAFNNNVNQTSSNNLLNLNDFKHGSSLNTKNNSTNSQSQIPLSTNSTSYSGNQNLLGITSSNYAGLSSPNNNIINQNAPNNPNNAPFYNKELQSTVAGNSSHGNITSNSGVLNIANLNDNGW